MNEEKKILDLGCGNKKREGAIGVDSNPSYLTAIKQ